MQAVERLAHWGLADAELIGKKLLGQTSLFIEIFAQNVGLDAVVSKRG